MIKCSIEDCDREHTERVFCVFLCDNHHFILYNMRDNVVTKPQMSEIIKKKLADQIWNEVQQKLLKEEEE